VTVVACALRLPRLSQRPLHTDEAVHAIKFADLLENGSYVYDPYEYHGPTLNYFTLIPAWLSGATRLVDISEVTLRIVPVFFGVLLVLLPLLVSNGLGRAAAAAAALMTAISPAMAFYSRYCIMEILLVFFTFGAIACAYRYVEQRRLIWALLAGLCLGLMHASKETCIIAYFAMAGALLLTHWMHRRDWSSQLRFATLLKPVDIAVTFAAAAAISVLFFSSFFTHLSGIVDSIRTYAIYFDRGGGNSLHIHPWYYYVEMLVFAKYNDGRVWSEAIVVLLALVGAFAVLRGGDKHRFDIHLGRFITFYTLIMVATYSVIPYKTPWNLLSFYHGLLLLAGVGMVEMVTYCRSGWRRSSIIAVLAVALTHLAWQAYLANFRYYEDSGNPYVYAHTVSDVPRIAAIVASVADAQQDGRQVHIEVICPENDYWPLPWYLRAFTNVGWWSHVDDRSPAAPIILAAPVFEDALMIRFYALPEPGKKYLYLPLFREKLQIRPGVELRGYVRKDLWDRFQNRPIGD
jgi:uncharacterized protein (TIGR03663 family)